MTERIPKSIWMVAFVLGPVLLAYLAYSHPAYFTSQTLLGGLLFLEFLVAIVWMYRQFYYPVVIVTFLFAGLNLPGGGGVFTVLRWVFLCVGALVGTFLMLRERSHHFGAFHIFAIFAVLMTLVSAEVSQFPQVALLKALSIGLLFLYGSTGVRIAVTGRENQFFTGLLGGCELFVGAVAGCYAVGIQMMGNPNSLGAVMGVVGAPILLWGIFLDEAPLVHWRRLVLYGICMYLVFHSHARAGMAAALVSSALQCAALRKYRAVVKVALVILVIVAAAAIIQPEAVSNTFSSLKASLIYKGASEGGVLASRESTWQAAINSIQTHLWFGIGLGTTQNAEDPREHLAAFSSNSSVTTENGSSYLSLLAGVGVLGAIPFSCLLLMLLSRILRTISRLRRTGNACHPAVPLAMIMAAGLIHAGFEDWLIAPGYYLCMFYWSLAFVFVDLAPASVRRTVFPRPFRLPQRGFSNVAPSR